MRLGRRRRRRVVGRVLEGRNRWKTSKNKTVIAHIRPKGGRRLGRLLRQCRVLRILLSLPVSILGATDVTRLTHSDPGYCRPGNLGRRMSLWPDRILVFETMAGERSKPIVSSVTLCSPNRPKEPKPQRRRSSEIFARSRRKHSSKRGILYSITFVAI